MQRPLLTTIVLCYSLVAISAAVAQNAPARFFTDQTGKFRVKATITNLNETHVKLRKVDGQEVTLPIAKLSDSDQTYLNRMYQQYKAMVGDYPIGTRVEIFSTGRWHPGEVLQVQPGKYFITFDKYSDTWNKWVTAKELRLLAAEPAEMAGNPKQPTSAVPSQDPANAAPKVLTEQEQVVAKLNEKEKIKTLIERAPKIDLATAAVVAFDFVPDPLPTVGQGTPPPMTISMSAEKVGTTSFAQLDPTLTHLTIDPVHFASTTNVATIMPISDQTSKRTVTIPSGKNYVGISDGGQAAFIRGSVKGSWDSFYQRLETNPTTATMEPSDPAKWFPCSGHITKERFLAGNRLLLYSLSDGIQLWDLQAAALVLQINGTSILAASGTGRYIACCHGKETVAVIDTQSNQVIGRFNLDG